jgi:hypothetical protein
MSNPGDLYSSNTLCATSSVLASASCAQCSLFCLLNIATQTVCLVIIYALVVVVVAIINAWTSFSFNSSAVGSPLQPPSLTINPGYLLQVNIMAGHKKHVGMIKTTARHRVSSSKRQCQDVLQAHKQMEQKQAGLVQ